MDKLLQKYKCAPSQAGKEWAQKFWTDKEKVVEYIEQCQAAQKLGVKKGKGVICAVLGACLSCAQQEAKETPAPKLVSDVEYTTLKSEDEVLKSSLACERDTGKTLGTGVDKLVSENNCLKSENSHLKQLLERVNHLLDKMQPSAPVKQIRRLMRGANLEIWDGDLWFDNDDGEVEGTSDSKPQLIFSRPLVKTETAVDDDDKIRTTVRTTPCSPAELIKIQEKFSRRSGESEVEYVWRVSLEGGDRIMLSEEEAGGFWGPGVFLTTTPGEHNYSLTARAAYWAGGIDPQERGEPLVIKATGSSDLVAAVQKAACIQAIYERDELRKSPMLAPIDPARLTPLIRGLPDCLKMFVANAQDRIQAACRDAGCDRRLSQCIPIPTWSEFAQDMHRYGRRTGWISSSSVKPPDHARRVRQVHTQNPKFNKERGILKEDDSN
ncbi:hypothetical protein QYF61_021131 [Mycteria americana]|uniref:Uncharacterized protein n=1 Tax=Mycteria americana TaxID=33587 RepID=A0AAN7NH50_MYCAM|nr:hypothetical protein QYF61_021131 [Mycteria americana]